MSTERSDARQETVTFAGGAMSEKPPDILTPRQRRVIPILVQARSIEEGAKLAGLSRTTVYKWSRLPDFKEELGRQRDELMNEGMDNLKSQFEKAVAVLAGLLDSENETTRRHAANDIIAHALKAKEIQELEERLSSMETLVYEKKTVEQRVFKAMKKRLARLEAQAKLKRMEKGTNLFFAEMFASFDGKYRGLPCDPDRVFAHYTEPKKIK